MKKAAHKSPQTETEVKALFLDYDGTISPQNVPLSESMVPENTLAVLNRIRLQIPIVMISTKDLGFLIKRTPFAHAWSGLGGLDTRIGNTTVSEPCLQNLKPQIAAALDYAKRFAGNGLRIEEKHDSLDSPAAFSVDWRQAKSPVEVKIRASQILSYCEALPLTIIRYEQQPFFDVFPCPVDKGKALRKIKKKLGVGGGVLYLGDSAVDNSAFKAADIAVGVMHEESTDELVCDYFVKFDDVHLLLEALLTNKLQFDMNLWYLREK